MGRSTKDHRRDKLPKQVFIKAAHLQKEGVPRKQAIAEAASMNRKGRLSKSGKYRRAK